MAPKSSNRCHTPSSLWRQMQADILEQPVTAMRAEEGPAFGAALLAGVGTGVYRDVAHAVDAAVRTGDTIEPNPATQ